MVVNPYKKVIVPKNAFAVMKASASSKPVVAKKVVVAKNPFAVMKTSAPSKTSDYKKIAAKTGAFDLRKALRKKKLGSESWSYRRPIEGSKEARFHENYIDGWTCAICLHFWSQKSLVPWLINDKCNILCKECSEGK